MTGWQLSRLSFSGKVYCSLFLVGIGAGSLAAVTQASTAVGLTPADIRASLQPEQPMTDMGAGLSGERELDLSEISDDARVWMRTPLLIQTSHTHLFGQTMIAGLLGLIFLGSSLTEWPKAVILSLPFLGTFMDIGGLWLTRFVSPGFALLVMAGGSLFALGYSVIAGVSFYELWLKEGGEHV